MEYLFTALTKVVGIEKTTFVIGNGVEQAGWLVRFSIQGMGREIKTEQSVVGGDKPRKGCGDGMEVPGRCHMQRPR